MTTDHQDALFTVTLPDEPGMVHGIKSTDPWVIQCDGCGLTLTKGEREPLVLFLGRIIFNPQHDGGEARMCPDCWKHHGWIDRSPHAGWEHLWPSRSTEAWPGPAASTATSGWPSITRREPESWPTRASRAPLCG